MLNRSSYLFFLIILLLASFSDLQAQVLTGISADWDDSFKEWTLYTDDQDLEGELKTRWMLNDDWSDWSFRLGEESGRLKIKWKDNPNEWDIRIGNEIITARTVFNNDFREWRIQGNNQNIRIKTRFRNIADEWEIATDTYGYFSIYTSFEGDPRDWYIVDELENVSLGMKMAMVFVALYSSIVR